MWCRIIYCVTIVHECRLLQVWPDLVQVFSFSVKEGMVMLRLLSFTFHIAGEFESVGKIVFLNGAVVSCDFSR